MQAGYVYCVADKSRMEPLVPAQLGASVTAAAHFAQFHFAFAGGGPCTIATVFRKRAEGELRRHSARAAR
jgi:hypothetical protein